MSDCPSTTLYQEEGSCCLLFSITRGSEIYCHVTNKYIYRVGKKSRTSQISREIHCEFTNQKTRIDQFSKIKSMTPYMIFGFLIRGVFSEIFDCSGTSSPPKYKLLLLCQNKNYFKNIILNLL